jgi:hypothetical protein
MTINTNTSAKTVQRHLAQHSRNLAAQFKAASEGSGDIAEISSGIAKCKLLTTAATLVLRKANDLQGRSIDLLA